MIHARPDYNRIIDLAAQAELLAAFKAAQPLKGSITDNDNTQSALDRLVDALAPLVALVDALPEGTRPIADDEPVFLIRGRKDKVAGHAVREYAHLARHAGADFEFVESAIAHAVLIEEYQSKHLSAALPDLAKGQEFQAAGSGE